jgi:hypothetical protein
MTGQQPERRSIEEIDEIAERHIEQFTAFCAGVVAAANHDETFEDKDEFSSWVRSEFTNWRDNK